MNPHASSLEQTLSRVQSALESASQSMESKRWALFFLFSILLLHLVQSTYVALWLSLDIVPDERYHINLPLSVFFEGNWALKDTPFTYQHNGVSRAPHLYHQILGQLLRFRPESWPIPSFLRLLNVGISLLTTLFIWRGARAAARGSALFALCACLFWLNTTMVVFLGGGVTYDNLVFLLQALLVCVIVRDFRSSERPSFPNLVLAGGLCALGLLVKITFAPVAFFCAVALLLFKGGDSVDEWKTGKLATWVRHNKLKSFWITSFACLSAAFTLELHGGNYLRYRTLAPYCDQVIGREACQTHSLQFRAANERIEKNAQNERVNFLAYSWWLAKHVRRSWDDVIGHTEYPVSSKTWKVSLQILTVALCLFLAWREGWRPWADKLWAFLALMVLFYGFVYFAQGYGNYLEEGTLEAGIQPRYLLPVFPALLMCALLPLFAVERQRWARTVLALVFVLTLNMDGTRAFFKYQGVEFFRPWPMSPGAYRLPDGKFDCAGARYVPPPVCRTQ